MITPVVNPLQNPSIELFGLRVDEPVTTITDIIVALIGIWGYFKIAKGKNHKHVTVYAWFFLGTGISTMIAGLLGHAFLYRFGYEIKMVGWVLGILGTCFAQFAAVYHAKETIGEKAFKTLLTICYLEVIVSMTILILKPSFVIVICHTAFGLLLMVTILESITYSKTKSKLSLMMVYGVGLAVLAIVAHTCKIAISKWFNHLDVSHVFLGLSIYVMIKGVLYEQKNNPIKA
ncbi:MAG: hypothetical protein KA163_14655 [Bacteroidia bacterium]|nr:hypothetical protein [Bacteroidia bacterium]